MPFFWNALRIIALAIFTIALAGTAHAQAPTVTGISPSAGPAAGGGGPVTISGTGFTGATAVNFGTTSAISFTADSDTQITATPPPGTVGAVDVTVTTPSGTSATSADDWFIYKALPTVSSVTPSSGPTAGANVVTIEGTGFSGVTAVKFGATDAVAFSNLGLTLISAVPPPGVGTVDVTVTATGGTSVTVPADQYSYTGPPPPIVTGLDVQRAPATGGTPVFIAGTGFTGTTAVKFGATSATSFTVVSDTQITAVSPAGTGTVDVTVTTPVTTSVTVPADQFTYTTTTTAQPNVTFVSPSSGPAAGGDLVTIEGMNFQGLVAVRFGGTDALGFSGLGLTIISAIAPPGVGTVDVTVVTAGGGASATGPLDHYTYPAPPTVTGLSPASGPTAGGTSVTITGTNFTGATAVKFGATSATSFTVNSATSITATSPAGTGTIDVTVTTPIGTSTTSVADQFSYGGSPTVTAISPSSGSAAGGTSVTLTGTNFTGVTAVKFGATSATSFTVNSATSITATSPAGTGTTDVTVTTSSGTSATSAADQFTYGGSPTVTAIGPSGGPAAGGTSVTLTGTNFTGATAVKFGAANATSFTVNSATSITATSPAGAGTVNVAVTTSFGTSATTAADQFTYASAITRTALTSSKNPSEVGQAVIFTATVSSGSGSPSGSVTFSDGGVSIGTAALSGGVATLTTSALKLGNHVISASYSGSSSFSPSTSPNLLQTVSVPRDSVRLRQLQIAATGVIAQNSGSAISGAMDTAISQGFGGGGRLITPDGTGIRFNFSADTDAADGDATAAKFSDRWQGSLPNDGAPSGNASGYAPQSAPAGNGVNDAFAAIDKRLVPTKAPVRYVEPKVWQLWAVVKGNIINHSDLPTANQMLYGNQVNALVGLTRLLTPDLLVGALGGYESFDYRSDALNGRLTGDGWTIGSYLGWNFASGLRFSAGAAYSGLGYDGASGTAMGNFSGQRWLLSGGLTGTYRLRGFTFEPSSTIYALWEHENAYTDSLGTQQDGRSFFTGRASAGGKISYPLSLPWWADEAVLAPYAGLYADCYFNRDDSSTIAPTGLPPLASVPILDGWSARATTGIAAQFANGTSIAAGAERGGIGGNVQIWTYKARASVPF